MKKTVMIIGMVFAGCSDQVKRGLLRQSVLMGGQVRIVHGQVLHITAMPYFEYLSSVTSSEEEKSS